MTQGPRHYIFVEDLDDRDTFVARWAADCQIEVYECFGGRDVAANEF